MGAYMKENDFYIGSLLDLFNIRFAPAVHITQVTTGIEEMAALQEEFDIFRAGRRFSEGAKLLGLGGIYNNIAKGSWFELLINLPDNGDYKIADALAANFKKRPPLPCYMMAHDLRPKGENLVKIYEGDRPLFYLEQTYLTISLPMAPRRKQAAKRAAKKK